MGPPSGLRSSWTPKPNAFFGFLPVLRLRRGCLPHRGPLPFFKKFSVRPIFFPRSPVILGGTRDSTAQKGGKNHGPRCRPDPPDEPGGRRGHRGLRPKVLPPDPGVLLLPSPPPPGRGGRHPGDLRPVLRLPGPVPPLWQGANYLYVIAGNLCRDHLRRRQELPLEDLPQEEAPPADWDTRLDLEAAFRALPEGIQAVAVLCLLQERKQREAAKILGIGLPLVKYRLRRARELLAQSLGKEALP